MVQIEAAILWWNPSGTGAVETDDRRHLRFVGARLPFEPRAGDKVLVTLDGEADDLAEQVVLGPLPEGRRERVALEEVVVEPALDGDEPTPVRIRPIGVEAPKLLRTDVDPVAADSQHSDRVEIVGAALGERAVSGEAHDYILGKYGCHALEHFGLEILVVEAVGDEDYLRSSFTHCLFQSRRRGRPSLGRIFIVRQRRLDHDIALGGSGAISGSGA